MILLFACTEPTDLKDPAPPADTAVPRPVLTSPAELDGGVLRAAPSTMDVGGETYDAFAYNGQIPGPTIRVTRGEAVSLILQNELADATTIHWHGQRVPEAMDGAGWVDGGVIPGTAFTYEFTSADAGTFWYHPHIDVSSQVDGGLYGAFIVEDPADPPVDRELVVVFDAWAEHTETDDDHHVLTDPNATVWTVNGLVDPVYPMAAGERVRVRMINASNQSYLVLGWPDIRLIGGDQGLYGAPEAADEVFLAPGDRAEVEWTPSASFDVTTAMWVAAGGAALGEDRRVFSVEVEPGEAATPATWPAGDATVSPDPGWTDLTYTFQGGGDGAWLINGEAWPDVTVHTLPLDVDTIVEVRNLSATNHPFHLHGQRFEVLSVDGVPLPARRIEDTVDVGIRQRVRLRVHADNPGEWLLHCHLFGHEEGGMMTRVRVE